jgi:titin
VSDLTANSCKLSWKAPESDGGKPLKHYIIERRDSKRYTWTEVETVRPKQTSVDVSRLIEGVEYDFRVFAENEEGRSPALETKDKTLCRKSACKY